MSEADIRMGRLEVRESGAPAWYDEAKFGIFIHWTAAAIPAYASVRTTPFSDNEGRQDEAAMQEVFRELPYAEMYQNTMHVPGSSAAEYHQEHYGGLPFDALVHQFRDGLDRWDPDAWAELFERAGARYVVLVTKTEDGFLLWPSAHPNPHREDWQAVRDVVGELATAVRARGMRFGVYYSGGLDWTFGGLPVTSMESMLAAMPQSDEFIGHVDAHWRELIERYRPAMMWNDYTYPVNADVASLHRFYREHVPDGIINDRFAGPREGIQADIGTLEYHLDTSPDYSNAPSAYKWEACRGIGTSFGYNRLENDETYQSSAALIHELVDIVAHGGNFLLNVGPTAAGDVPWLQAERLLTIGWWLRRYGEAVYGTTRWEDRKSVV